MQITAVPADSGGGGGANFKLFNHKLRIAIVKIFDCLYAATTPKLFFYLHCYRDCLGIFYWRADIVRGILSKTPKYMVFSAIES